VYSPVLEQLGLDHSSIGGNVGHSVIKSDVFGNSYSDFHSTSVTSSDLLRQSSSFETRVPAPPPGFSSPDLMSMATTTSNRYTGLSLSDPMDSVQETLPGNDKCLWNVNERRRLASVDILSSDLGSILKLSESDRPERERANTYTPCSNVPLSLPSSQIHNNRNDSYISDSFAAKGLDSFRY
jgi:hypothetical protein